MLAALLLLAVAAEEPKIEAPIQAGAWHFAGFPIVSYSSDTGFTGGAAIFLYAPDPKHPGEEDKISFSASYATRGPKQADASWSSWRILGAPLRTYVNLHGGDDALMPYWGEGGQLGGLSVPTGSGTPPPPYRYHDRRYFIAGLLRGPFGAGFGWHVRARFLDVNVHEQSALLAESAPPGARGGRVALFEAGVLYDSRDREVGTHRGLFVTAAAFAAPQISGVSDFSFHGYDAAARAYVPFGGRLVLALRALYDRKIAGVPSRADETPAVPFFERSLYEGITFGEGLGGASTVRGIARYRLSGDEKALGNAELRATVVTTHLFSKPQEWGLSAAVDGGWARQPGYPAIDAAGAAAGLRLIWDRSILMRFDVAHQIGGGEATVYLSFGEQF